MPAGPHSLHSPSCLFHLGQLPGPQASPGFWQHPPILHLRLHTASSLHACPNSPLLMRTPVLPDLGPVVGTSAELVYICKYSTSKSGHTRRHGVRASTCHSGGQSATNTLLPPKKGWVEIPSGTGAHLLPGAVLTPHLLLAGLLEVGEAPEGCDDRGNGDPDPAVGRPGESHRFPG